MKRFPFLAKAGFGAYLLRPSTRESAPQRTIAMGYRVAVVGATGNVGREMLQILAERNFPADDVVALASARSVGKQTSFGDKAVLKVQDLAKFDFKGIDIVLSSPGAKVSAEHSPRAAKAGAVVIDNTSYWRMDPDVPLVVPEVNAKAIAGYKGRGIIANPNCSTIQMVVALKPIHEAARIRRVVVATYQSTSGAGKDAMDEVLNQTKSFFVNQTLDPKKFSKNIAFNVIPHIDVFMDDGSTRKEMEDGGRDQEDPRSQDQGPRHLRARADLRRPCRGGESRARAAARRTRGPRAARRPARRAGGRSA